MSSCQDELFPAKGWAVDSSVTWKLDDFISLKPHGDYYLCENLKRPGYHIASRSFNSLGGRAEWSTLKYLSQEEVYYAVMAGIEGWECKPRVRVPAWSHRRNGDE